jgi:hypothetical protein
MLYDGFTDLVRAFGIEIDLVDGATSGDECNEHESCPDC